jgi:large repetitive protein
MRRLRNLVTPRVGRRRIAVFGPAIAVAAMTAGGLLGPVPAAARPNPTVGGELVIIDSVTVGKTAYVGICNSGGLAIPVTVVATFVTNPPNLPVGPYAVDTVSNGFGTADNHFGTPEGHAPTQVFHLLISPSQYSNGTGTGTVIVQDVGLAGGYAQRDFQYSVPLNMPFRGPNAVKCPTVNQVSTPADYAKTLASDLAKDFIDKYVCPGCLSIYDQINDWLSYGDELWNSLTNAALQDPPDNDYQQIAVPSPPPVLTPPKGLSAAQKAAAVALESRLAASIGDAQAMSVSMDRAWGAGNADSEYWYHIQMQALARFASRTSSDLRQLPAAYAAVQAAFSKHIPSFPVTVDDVSSMVATLVNGLPSNISAVMTKLGVSEADQQEIAQNLLGADQSQLETSNGAPYLLAPPQDYDALADALDGLASWAAGTINDQRPVITGLSYQSGPASGGTSLTVNGLNLGSVTGISFGPSTENSGLGSGLTCTSDQCDVIAPPGTGTVDVTASAPGGPSARTSADRFSYIRSSVPAVTHIFPATGSIAGGTSVSVFGSALDGGAVFFGPDLASSWTCTEDLCTAVVPPSAGPDSVNVTVSSAAGSSATNAGDRFTFTSTAPPPPKPPVVTGVSPSSGNSQGGDQVTITGKRFTGATAVDFGTVGASSYVVLNDTHIMATTPADQGKTDVTVYNSAGSSTVTSKDRFTFIDAKPVVTAISPRRGPTTGGTTVKVTGRNLNQGQVTFGPIAIDLNSTCTPTQCTGTTPPEPAGVLNIGVENGNGQSAAVAADRFTYVRAPAPVITSIDPANGSTAGGTSIAIFGKNLAGANVTIGGQQAGSTLTNPCSLTVCSVITPPGKAGAARVVVTRTDGSASRPATFTYLRPGPPSITAVEPNFGWLKGVGQTDVIGQNLTGGVVYFGNIQASFDPNACSQTDCSFFAPIGAKTGTVDVSVRTPGGRTPANRAARYTYVLPTITKVSPSSGWTIGGAKVTITGTSLSGGSVSFGGTPAPSFTCTDTACTGTSPLVSSAGLVNVLVTVANGIAWTATTAADHFTYKKLPDPTVTGVTPDSGTDQGGDQVVVTGKYLDGGTVSFGANQAQSSSCTDTKCVAITPYSSTDGTVNVTVTTSTATSKVNSSDRFTYHPPGTPTVTKVTPSSGTGAGGTPVIVTGKNLTDGVVEFAGGSAYSSTCLATSCSAVSPPGSGTVDVQVATSTGTSAITPADKFTYTIPPGPKVTGSSPASGPETGGSFVTVTGSHLANGTVMFGAAAATDSACGASSCTATAPGGHVGSVDVTVKTLGGTTAVTRSARFTYLPISLSESAIPGLSSGEQAGGGHVYVAPDGTTWFTMPKLAEIGKIAPNGKITARATLDSSSTPDAITQTSNGTAWYTEYADNKIVSINSAGHQTGYQIPGQGDNIADITVGPDGRLWFTLYASGAIGAMATSGQVSIYQLPNISAYPVNIVTGPDGRLWFTEGNGDAVGAITTSGHITEYPVPGNGVEPWGLTVGPDGRLWFAEQASDEIGAITTSGVVTLYPLPASDGLPEGIALGPDGRLWYTQLGFDQVSALNPSNGAVTDYPLPGGYTGIGPRYLAMAKDGSLWVSELASDTMIHVTGITTGVKPAVTSVSPAYGPAAGGTTVTITGANLGGATAVSFGTAKANHVLGLDAAHVVATAPAGHGTVEVTVITPHGTAARGAFHYGRAPAAPPAVTGVSPAVGRTAGGTKVTITGANLSHGKVRFGRKAAAHVSCGATSCTATAPPGRVGTVDVRVATAGGVSPVTRSDQFTYQVPAPPVPVVRSVTPASGPTAGGNTVTIHGNHLAGGTVTFGLNQAVATCSETTCTVTAPPGGAGVVDVHVTTPGGTSAIVKGDRYRYRI